MRRRTALGAAALLALTTVFVSAHASPAAAADPPDGFVDVAVAGASRGTTIEWLPSGQIVVLEQRSGRVLVGPPDGPLTTALDLPVCTESERGMLGFTHDPAFLGNGFVYVYYTVPGPNGCVNRVSRFQMSGSTIDPGTEAPLLDNIASTGRNHNGGDLDFGSDGFLYVAIGDAGTDPRGDSGSAGSNDAAQDLSLLNGKIARITPFGEPAPGNPFTGAGTTPCRFLGTSASTTIRCQEIFSWGLRNPFRFAFDRNDGSDTFFINDVGQGTFEEVNLGGVANFGWPIREGNCPQGQTPPCDGPPSSLADPVTQYGRDLGAFITAGAFVPDGLWPSEFDGGYLFADGGSGNIWLRSADGTVDYDEPFATGAFGIADMTFGFDTDGTMVLFYVQTGGGVRMISPSAPPTGTSPSDLKFVPITPTRAYDTSNEVGGPAGNVLNGTTRLVELDAPAGARAAFVNLTYDRTAGPGFLRTWAARSPRPETSSLNADRANTTAANAAVVALADDGSFVVESFTTGRMIVDVMGWFVDTPEASDDGRFVALGPLRSVDTRIPAGNSLDSGSTNRWTRSGDDITVDVTGELGVPADGTAAAVVLSVGAIPRLGLGGFVGGYPGGSAYPGTSNVNVLPGEVRGNMMIVPLGADGDVALRALNIADVVVDVAGYITSDSATSSSTGLYTPIDPTRMVDTREPIGFPTLAPETTATTPTPDSTEGASAIVQNITATQTSGPGFIASFPGTSVPDVSNVNYDAANQTRAALAFTNVADDTISYTSLVRSELVVDVVGFFSD